MSAAERDLDQALALDCLSNLLGFHLRLANGAMSRSFAERLAELDLTQKQCATLQIIATNEGISQTKIAEALAMDRSTMMGLIDRLQDRGLLLRRKSRDDGRRQALRLTARGTAVLRRANELIERHEQDFIDRFSKSELAALFEALKRIHQRH